MGSLVFLGIESLISYALKCIFHPLEGPPTQDGDRVTPLLTTSVFRGAQLHQEVAEDAEGCELTQMGCPDPVSPPVGHLEAFAGQTASQPFTDW